MSSNDRDQQVLSRLARIQHKVDSMELTQAFAMRAEADKHLETVKAIFGRSTRRAQVYIAANGVRSVEDIAQHLNMKGPNVSKELATLMDEGLLEISDIDGGQTFYAKTPIGRTLRISKYLHEKFALKNDGAQI